MKQNCVYMATQTQLQMKDNVADVIAECVN